ncbi:hypothetical protein LptCag_0639 [Leptospirillum ferriphilum]|uniref:Uncharacterized protein n=1 Tax=Leptospirillum ferriphilum TaxID=178606 RepID=A0A094W937_9BACT|nr:hypothetical protein LptCag_0639 [Leptospirillum ferriphilum]
MRDRSRGMGEILLLKRERQAVSVSPACVGQEVQYRPEREIC